MSAFTHDGPGIPAETWAARPEWGEVPLIELHGFQRVVVVAAHPDDETLGAGGLVALAAAAGIELHLVVCTAGEHSHPDSTTHEPEVLAKRRNKEVRAALRELAPNAALTTVDVEDGRVADHEQAVAELLVRLLGDARNTLVVAPWRHDGHVDHDAAGRAAATAVHRSGATLWEYPIWWWHWGSPEETPWPSLRRLDLTEAAIECRGRALAHHRSQTEPLSDLPGDEALLQAPLLRHFSGPFERFIVQPTTDHALDRLHLGERDPWRVDDRWYERRKRAITLAMLPRDRFARGLEIGCSIGALTSDLAQRCDTVLALDSSPAAIESARQRLAADSAVAQHVHLQRADVPTDWPEGSFDLIVVSEVGYFLSPRDLDALAERIRDSLTPDGVLLLCHWRHPMQGWVLDGPLVHAAFEKAAIRRVQARHTERDFEALVLSTTWPAVDA